MSLPISGITIWCIHSCELNFRTTCQLHLCFLFFDLYFSTTPFFITIFWANTILNWISTIVDLHQLCILYLFAHFWMFMLSLVAFFAYFYAQTQFNTSQGCPYTTYCYGIVLPCLFGVFSLLYIAYILHTIHCYILCGLDLL